MSRLRRLFGLGERAVEEAEALKKASTRIEPALDATKTSPLKPDDVADYLQKVKETGQTHRAGATSNQPPAPPTPPRTNDIVPSDKDPKKSLSSRIVWPTVGVVALGGVVLGGDALMGIREKLQNAAITGGQSATNTNTIVSGGGNKSAETLKQIKESFVLDLSSQYLSGYLDAANSKDKDPKNVIPDLTEAQKQGIRSAISESTSIAFDAIRPQTLRSYIPQALGGHKPQAVLTEENYGAFMNQFRAAASQKIGALSLPQTTPEQIQQFMLQDYREDNGIKSFPVTLKEGLGFKP